MARANIADFKARISYFVKLLKRGESVTLCERNVPIAEVTPVTGKERSPRNLGQHRGQFIVSADAWKPLTDEELHDLFGDAF